MFDFWWLEMAMGMLQIRKPRKKRSVMGCELSRQLSSPGRVCGSMVVVVVAVR